MASLLASLGPRARKALRYAGYVALALVSFVFALQLTFPYDRVKDWLIYAASEKYDITVGDVERGIVPARVYFKAVTLRTRPTKAGEVATTFYIEQAEVDAGLLSLLHGTYSGKIDLKIGSGHITGRGAFSTRNGLSVHVAGDDVPSASLPMREVLGLPMSGKVRLALNAEIPMDRSKAGKSGLNLLKGEGNAEFACPSGCTVGDGKTKLKLTTNNARQQEFLDQGGGGIDFGKVNVDSLVAAAELKNGKLELTRFELKSADGEAHIAFSLALNQDFQSSTVTGCLRFHGSEALRKREPKTDAALSTTGGPLGPDGLFHIKLEGQLRMMRRLPYVCGPGASGGETPGGAPPRPNLTITPEPPAKPPGLGTVGFPSPSPTPQPPPTPAPPPAAAPPASPAATPPATGGVPAEGPPPVVYPSTGSGVPGAAAPGSPPPPPAASGAPQ